jgi:hypothetical protein
MEWAVTWKSKEGWHFLCSKPFSFTQSWYKGNFKQTTKFFNVQLKESGIPGWLLHVIESGFFNKLETMKVTFMVKKVETNLKLFSSIFCSFFMAVKIALTCHWKSFHYSQGINYLDFYTELKSNSCDLCRKLTLLCHVSLTRRFDRS